MYIIPANTNNLIVSKLVIWNSMITIPHKKSLSMYISITNIPYQTTTKVYPNLLNATLE